jgi:hypothetical protein
MNAIILFGYKLNAAATFWQYYIFDVFLIISAHVILFLAASRAGLLAMLVLDLCLIKNMALKKGFVVCLLTLLIAGMYLFLVNPGAIGQRLESRQKQRFTIEGIQADLLARLSPLTTLNALELLIGKGIGPTKTVPDQVISRKDNNLGIETHNMFGWILEHYGLIGLSFFLLWLFPFCWRSRAVKDAMWIWASLLTFGMSGVLVRSRLFWIFLGLLSAILRIHREALGEQHKDL